MDISPFIPTFSAYPLSVSQPSQEEKQEQAGIEQEEKSSIQTSAGEDTKDKKESSSSTSTSTSTRAGLEDLSPEEVQELEKLKARDAEVRTHEMAHLAAAGGLAMSGASYTYERGADGVNYAVGGEVKIDTSEGSTPEETIQRAQTIYTAALAPAEPSAQDRSVAAAAMQMETKARAELAEQKQEETTEALEKVKPTAEEGTEKSNETKEVADTQEQKADEASSPAIKQYQEIFHNEETHNHFHLAV